jgi:hypothetical protein
MTCNRPATEMDKLIVAIADSDLFYFLITCGSMDGVLVD